ncbi:MAG TPA: hypothetical protein PKN93_15195, partial [Leptospiraceae bacterium]|nr:hypothetical protein [Leptospiraceae bacterium]
MALATSDSNPPASPGFSFTLRLFRYLFRYKTRIVFGVLFSVLVSLSNLVSITALVPIFNAIGETGPIEVLP